MPALSLRHRIETRLIRALLRLPPPLLRRIAGRPIERDGHTLDLHVQAVLALQRHARKPALHGMPLADARRELLFSALVLAPPARPVARVVDREIAGPAGALPVRIYTPRDVPTPAPALVYYHGGGFALGDLDSHDGVCRILADDARCVVVSVDYRRAPEHRFPAAVDDAIAAFRWVAQGAAALAIDPRRIAVAGDSAGGNLAAVVANETRGDPQPPRFQALIYPVVDFTQSFPSIRGLGEGFFLEKATMDWFRDHYLPPGGDPRDRRASPYFADVAGVAPALVLTAGFDPLRDEGDAYARKLADAGVPVEHRCHGSMFHGFTQTSGSVATAEAGLADVAAALRRAFADPA